METKIENLMATNALLREDMDVSKKALARAVEENRKMLIQIQNSNSKHEARSASIKLSEVRLFSE